MRNTSGVLVENIKCNFSSGKWSKLEQFFNPNRKQKNYTQKKIYFFEKTNSAYPKMDAG